jgi:hypothetical protein
MRSSTLMRLSLPLTDLARIQLRVQLLLAAAHKLAGSFDQGDEGCAVQRSVAAEHASRLQMHCQ